MKVLISDKINEKAINIIKNSGIEVDYKLGLSESELISIIQDYDALLVRSDTKVTSKILDSAKKLKIVGRAGVGTDNIDKEHAKKLGIVVENAPFGNTNAAAEHTLTLMMMLSKHIIHANESMKKNEWDRSFKSTELKEKNLGLIGFGKVGTKVAKVAVALEMNVLIFDPFSDEEKIKELGAKKVDFEELITKSDYISPHIPLNEKTKNLISEKEFDKMKDGVKILNVARGGVINEEALLRALKNNKVSAAGLDVFENEPPQNRELIENQRVIATPHLGASTIEAQVNVALEIAEQIVLALKENKIINCVNGVEKIKQ